MKEGLTAYRNHSGPSIALVGMRQPTIPPLDSGSRRYSAQCWYRH